jgi:small subunit ribosomal protein S6
MVGSLKEYETVFVLHPNAEEARVEEEIEGVRQIVEASTGTVIDVERWGRRKLAYEVRKVNEGIYTLVRFRSGPGVIHDLERRYRLKEDVLRHLTVLSHGMPTESIRREPPAEALRAVAPGDATPAVATSAVATPAVAQEAVPGPVVSEGSPEEHPTEA